MEGIDINDLRLNIKRVKDISFIVNEHLYIPDPNKVIKIEMQHTIGTNETSNLINFTLRVFLKYDDSLPETILADLYVQNIFEVPSLRKFIKKEGLNLPAEILISIVSLSISHSRALLSKNLGGTVYQEILLPVTNAVDVTNHFFPGVIQMQSESDSTTHGGASKRKSSGHTIGKFPPSKNSY